MPPKIVRTKPVKPEYTNEDRRANLQKAREALDVVRTSKGLAVGDIQPTEEYQERKKALENNSIVKRPIDRLDARGLKEFKAKNGRKKAYSPIKIMNMINKYFDWCEENDELPSIKGMCAKLGFYKDMFYRYMRTPEYADIMEQARLHIVNWCESDIYRTKGLCTGKLGYMKNVHNWTDKVETHNTTEVISYTPDEARARIEMLAPRLLEVLKDNMILEQLTKRNDVQDAEVVK